MRGSEDLPQLLRCWVLEDPAWRVVKIEETGGRKFGITLIHVKHDADFDYAWAEFPRDFDRDATQSAILEVLQDWYFQHGVFNPDPYDKLDRERLAARC